MIDQAGTHPPAGDASDGGEARSASRSPAAPALDLGRIYNDPSVAELVCRYPNEPTVTLRSAGPREVVVELNGRPVSVAVRNGQLGRAGRQYLLISSGSDRGLWLLIEPGEELE